MPNLELTRFYSSSSSELHEQDPARTRSWRGTFDDDMQPQTDLEPTDKESGHKDD